MLARPEQQTKTEDQYIIDLGQFHLTANGLEKGDHSICLVIFNIYAAAFPMRAPNELPTESSHDCALTEITTLNRKAGYKDRTYQDDTEWFNALGNGEYDSEWVIPPVNILQELLSMPETTTRNDRPYWSNTPSLKRKFHTINAATGQKIVLHETEFACTYPVRALKVE